jgi:heme A synthase
VILAYSNGFDAVTALFFGFIYHGGGFLLAGLCVYFALRGKSEKWSDAMLMWAMAILLLMVQGGCRMVASGLQKAFN